MSSTFGARAETLLQSLALIRETSLASPSFEVLRNSWISQLKALGRGRTLSSSNRLLAVKTAKENGSPVQPRELIKATRERKTLTFYWISIKEKRERERIKRISSLCGKRTVEKEDIHTPLTSQPEQSIQLSSKPANSQPHTPGQNS